MVYDPIEPGSAPAREIPFNYTSAGDSQAVALLLGEPMVAILEELRGRRVTGRSARLLMRFLGEILIHRRNPYLFQELIDSRARRGRFFEHTGKDLAVIEQNAAGEARVHEVLAACRELLTGFRSDVETAPALRRRLKRELGAVIGAGNVRFDPFALVAHATDATVLQSTPSAAGAPELADDDLSGIFGIDIQAAPGSHSPPATPRKPAGKKSAAKKTTAARKSTAAGKTITKKPPAKKTPAKKIAGNHPAPKRMK